MEKMMDGGMKMMINSLNNNQSGYHNRNQCISIQCGGEYERNASRPSGRKESREAALTRRIRQLEQRVFALEEMLLKADELQYKTAEEALVAQYGEIMGVTRSTVYAMLADGHVEAAGGGKRVNVRSIARYLA